MTRILIHAPPTPFLVLGAFYVDYKKALAALLPDADEEPYRKPGTTTVMVNVMVKVTSEQ